jgi:DNA-binding response OmpR family regulator
MHKILIVDDDPTLVDFLKLLLESEGYETRDSVDGESALQEIRKFEPEVVLLDYMMPNMDGLDVLRHVSKHHVTSFVVMLTGKGNEEVAVECMKAGAVDYVLKPFDNERLLSVIRNALRYRETELERRQIISNLKDLSERLAEILSRASAIVEQAKQTAQANQLEELNTLLEEARKKVQEVQEVQAMKELSQ